MSAVRSDCVARPSALRFELMEGRVAFVAPPDENSQIVEQLGQITEQLRTQNELLLKIAQYYEREMRVPRLLPQ